jgi:outer membrane protein, multidrug efflux system
MRVLLLVLALLSACSVGPDFTPPTPPGVAKWNDSLARSNAVSTGTNPDPKWWAGFNDPILARVIDQAIGGNLDLQQAVVRVVEAQQTQAAAGAAALPTVGANGSYMREQLGLRGLLLSQGADKLGAGSPAVGGILNQLGQPTNLFQYGLSSSWELDLFGRVRRSVEQAKASTEAQTEATSDALVMLEGQVAQAYVQLRGAQALALTQRQNVETARQSLALTQRRQAEGLSTDLDVAQARTQLADYEFQLPGYEKQAQQAMNRLSVLTGQPPGALDAMLGPSAPLPKVPLVVDIGVPSSLARRRPDIREAEAKLHAATANIGVATAAFYPDISLTGNFGLRAIDGSFLTNWASSFYAFGPSVSLPIFQGGRLTAGLRLARAQAVESALAYRGTVLNALQEVEDALVAYRTDQAARAKLVEAVRSGELALYLARDRYVDGLADFLQVLDTERTLVGSRQQLVQADVSLTNDVVALYDALGGGWQIDAASAQPPVIATSLPITPAAVDSLAPVQPVELGPK